VQLVGPGELRLNSEKPVSSPGPTQILVQTEAVGLCFSDMKLLKQFDHHVRKAPITAGIDRDVLSSIPSYVPESKPTVPGHEVVCRVVAVGDAVRHYRIGQRFIVQADYRDLKTAGSNAAFGYNFEGGLQEYVLLDERVIGDPMQVSGTMIAVPPERGASEVALVEPWACVENSYVSEERLGQGERVLHVSDIAGLRGVSDESLDDVIVSSASAEVIEAAETKLAKNGRLIVLLNGQTLDRSPVLDVGRLHYGGLRYVGTTGADLRDAYGMIPESGEIRATDRALVVGAGGPMGQMHVIRLLLGFPGVQVVASDTSQDRLKALAAKVSTFANADRFRTVLAAELDPSETFDYFALMAPVPALVADAIQRARSHAIVNVFAGIPVGSSHPIDLQRVIESRIFMFGTSGSEPRDMRIVLEKVLAHQLDTNLSVAAVSGMAGAVDGLKAVEERTLDGKIIVYPSLHDLPLIPLADMHTAFPTVAAKLQTGSWTAAAEAELLRIAASQSTS
jgi:threonine dehydrogenase-like Zn-dependent dehydrogenase